MATVRVQELQPGSELPESVFSSPEPVLLPGYISHWPVVQQARKSDEALADYLSRFDAQHPVTVYVGDEKMAGRYFYNEDFSGFNFKSGNATLAQVLGRLLSPSVEDGISSIYVGSTPVERWLPGFKTENDVGLPVTDPLMNFWLGGRTTISAHFDFPDNLACVGAGKRRFNLFPPEQIDNLYIGPIDRTPAGQAISLVNFDQPDLDEHPKFKQALEHRVQADLEPGDALFIPSMWWHQVSASDTVNLLINYWWALAPLHVGSPMGALNHALLAIRELPERQRTAWKKLFDYYVFSAGENVTAHIPPAGRGMLEKLDDQTVRRVRDDLIDRLKP